MTKRVKTEADKRAAQKYIKEHMQVLGVKVRKEEAQLYHNRARENGTTVNAILHQALRDFVQEHPPKATEQPNATE